ncbi:Beta carbonic anhydrase 1 [Apostichopus japonicus]|uniref:Carbonic anhydrase n=1 Tax=Stichopus japonicus TaxID=307972 RepID=A0A2G8LGE8_STIJA|nr:Beta carbonic anhydrase 1 [Apostichopus japonicus]
MSPKVRSVGLNCHRTNATVSYAEPTTLLITCMDRRVNPDVYLKMDLGSTFILRNPGNFVPHAADVPTSQSSSELAALEMTVNMLNLKNIIVCGHSDCKAIHTLRGLKQCCVPPEAHQGPLATWLKTGGKRTWYKYLTEQQKEGYHTMFSNISDSRLMSRLDPESKLCTEDRISQINVLQQIENICSHNFLQDTLRGNSVQLQGMWVDVHDQTTHIFNWQKMRFIEVQNVKEQVHDRT